MEFNRVFQRRIDVGKKLTYHNLRNRSEVTVPGRRIRQLDIVQVGIAIGSAVREAALGFKQLIVPSSNAKEIRADISVRPVRRVDELIPMLFA